MSRIKRQCSPVRSFKTILLAVKMQLPELGDDMQRRDFVMLLGAAAGWPLAVHAQRPSRVPTVGFLSPNSYAAAKAWTTAFVQRLHDLGWIESRTVQIEYRWEDGQVERTSEFVNELVRLKVDVIVTHGVPNIVGAIKATSTIPIVFPLATDPVGSGFVASLARPGGNVTGLSIQSRDLAGKRLGLLSEILPSLHRLALMGDPAATLEMKEVQAVPVENQIRTYSWCNPPRIGRQRMRPALFTVRDRGASLSKAKCVRVSLIRRRCASPKTMMWSKHSRRIDPINRSAKPFCQGEAGAIGLSRMPMARSRRVTTVP